MKKFKAELTAQNPDDLGAPGRDQQTQRVYASTRTRQAVQHNGYPISEALSDDVLERLAAVIRTENEALLERHAALRPLLTVADVARSLNVSQRTVETLIASGQLHPLWIRGQRRFHPDTIDAYLRRCERRTSRTNKRREVVR